MMELLLPRTDAGVLAQMIAATVAYAGVAYVVRQKRNWVILIVGLWVSTYGLFAVRTLH